MHVEYMDMEFLPDRALCAKMRSLAGDLRAEGLTRIAPNALARGRIAQLRRLLDATPEGNRCAPMCAAAQKTALVEAEALAGFARGPKILPACGDRPRIQRIAREILLCSDGMVSPARLKIALKAFDGVRPLSMEELLQAGEAVRVEAIDLFSHAVAEISRIQRERNAAEKYIEDNGPLMGGVCFLERALQLARENGETREELWHAVASEEGGEQGVVARASRMQAKASLWAENLAGSARIGTELNPEELLEISDAAKILKNSAAYRACDEESRALIRRRIGEIARYARREERTIVETALQLGEDESDISAARYWTTDEGRRILLAKMGCKGVALPKIVPDPKGFGYMTAVFLAAAALFWGFGAPGILCAAILCVGIGAQIVNSVATRIVQPACLLRLQLDFVPEKYRTLVVIPAILPSPARAKELARQMEILAAQERDPNVEFCLLGDFPDADQQHLPGDDEILRAVRENLTDPRVYFLHRQRQWCEQSGRWMGRERKRGALHALNALLLRGDNALWADGQDAEKLRKGFRFVITIDADTRPYPGSLRRLIGALAHPLNENIGVLQPRMALSADGNAFSRCMAGAGGVSGYGGGISEVYQDLCAQGGYAGKGIYRAAEFAQKAELPENSVLSHDLLEGFLVGSAFAGDIVFLDNFPKSLASLLKRTHRWTRGDWQNLPFLRGRTPLQKFRMLENLRASLAPAAALLLIFVSLAAGSQSGIALALAWALIGALLSPADGASWLRAVLQLSILPNEAACRLDAAIRALWRTFVSRKNMLEWVSAADAERISGNTPLWPRVFAAALCAVLGALGGYFLPGFAFSALFLLGAPILENIQEADTAVEVSEADRTFLHEIAAQTWDFFAKHTPETGFPPDNVQFNPEKEPAERTSPTNIGLYMASCVGAMQLDLIDSAQMLARLRASLESLHRAEKWRGLLYNWIDPRSLAPLRPKFVSSVDNGNLAACLLLCSNAARAQGDGKLARELWDFAEKMDLGALYDGVRKLFFIGYDAEKGAYSASRYDLLASESRILSYTAIALGKISPEHWRALSRACVPAGGGSAPVSWSGTMFEYLMPELFLPTPRHSLLGQGVRACVAQQTAHRVQGLWGVSESGFYSFDARQNYQYRAFGVRELMLKDERSARVIAPYASALALEIAPKQAVENLRKMVEKGLTTPCGLAEAVDFDENRLSGRECGVVCSAMAHHQGMILLACANVLTGGRVRDFYAQSVQMQAISPLLDELPAKPERRARSRKIENIAPKSPLPRRAQIDSMPPDAHPIALGGSSLYIRADGEAQFCSEGVQVNRFSPDWQERGSGFFTHLRCGGEAFSLTDGQAKFQPGMAEFVRRSESFRTTLAFFLSPEDGALVRRVRIENCTDRPMKIELRDAAQISLCTPAQAAEHPAFHNLFLECSFPARHTMRIARRPREIGEGQLALDYAVSGLRDGEKCDFCADRFGMLRRGAEICSAQNVFASPWRRQNPGAGLHPVQAARINLTIQPREAREIGFASLVARDPDSASGRYAQMEALQRAQKLALGQSQELARFYDLPKNAALGKAAGMCLYSRTFLRKQMEIGVKITKEALWPIGISGERPILLAQAGDTLRGAQEILRLQRWLGAHGIDCDAVVFCDDAPGYDLPARESLLSHAQEGTLILEKSSLAPETLRALWEFAALWLSDGENLEEYFAKEENFAQQPKFLAKDLPGQTLRDGNFGAFLPDGSAYEIDLAPGESTPAAWCNVLAGENFGGLVSERGGGFFWYKNARNGRITRFANDPAEEGAPIVAWLDFQGEKSMLFPRDGGMKIRVQPGETRWIFDENGLKIEIVRYTEPKMAVHAAKIRIESETAGALRIFARANFLMGVHAGDLRALQTKNMADMQVGTGAMDGAACLRHRDAQAQGENLVREIWIEPGKAMETEILLCAADDLDSAMALAREYDAEKGLREVRKFWRELLSGVEIQSNDPVADGFVGKFLPYQAISARFWGRAGLYQGGGAFGFRDQLQDAMCLCPLAPKWTRAHILLCAAHQFPEGDVQHWWHPERTGVRTKISDDRLFLPWAAARYVLETGDRSILQEIVPYLRGEEIPPGKHDHYFAAEISDLRESLQEHCLRAIRLAAGQLGAHGLPLMGSGDWNDGMDRIGAQGRGESVWLAEFLAVVARDFAEALPETAQEMHKIRKNMLEALEEHGWDGDRYLRAYRDDGAKVGSESTKGGCKIDALSQSWAVFAGCDAQRTKAAMDTMWARLYDSDRQILRLLDPPFDGNIAETGYIAAYPPGIRENGGQYTHAACWALLAFAKMGDRRAWTLFRALLPMHHADTREKAEHYRVEPYALAADIYACGAGYAGRGGWTWYTGAAGWLYRAFLEGIAGFERRGDKVRLNALLDKDMDELRVRIRFGGSRYTLISRRDAKESGWQTLADDGKERELVFSAR